jgi:hypothetical protein
MVDAYREHKENLKPYLKLGHSENQAILKDAGLPAAGWVSNMYRKGQSLVADFENIPDRIYELILKKAYKKVSSEIYWNVKIGEKTYKRFLSGVALLGAELPGVTSIKDILNFYDLNAEILKTYTDNGELKKYIMEDTGMNEQEVKELTEKLEAEKQALLAEETKKYTAIEAELKTVKDAQEAKDKELEDLKKFKADADAKVIESELKLKQAELDKYITSLETDKLLSAAMKPMAYELMSDKKEYKLNDKEITKEDMLKDFLKLSQELAKVNFENNSEAAVVDKKDDEALIQAYMAEHKCEYVVAYKAIVKK